MPFLWRRTRENFILFLLMGIIHFIVYQRVTLPDVPSALPISYGGFLLIAYILYVYFLYIYLVNVGEFNAYIRVNVVSYLIYMVFHYLIYAGAVMLDSFFDTIYMLFFRPYTIFKLWGLKGWLSALIIHVICLVTVVVMPLFIRNNFDPLEDYLNRHSDHN